MKKTIIGSKKLAEFEDKFEGAIADALTDLVGLIVYGATQEDVAKLIIHDELIDTGYSVKFKELAYEFFQEIGYDIESDGLDF